MAMKLTKLQQLVEAGPEVRASAHSREQIVDKFHKYSDKVTNAVDDLRDLQKFLVSPVLHDFLKLEGFPSTEVKAATEAVSAAIKAMHTMEEAILDNTMSFGIHHDEESGDTAAWRDDE